MSQVHRKKGTFKILLCSHCDSKLLWVPPRPAPRSPTEFGEFDSPNKGSVLRGAKSWRALRGRLSFLLSNPNAAERKKKKDGGLHPALLLFSNPAPDLVLAEVGSRAMSGLLLQYLFFFLNQFSYLKKKYLCDKVAVNVADPFFESWVLFSLLLSLSGLGKVSFKIPAITCAVPLGVHTQLIRMTVSKMLLTARHQIAEGRKVALSQSCRVWPVVPRGRKSQVCAAYWKEVVQVTAESSPGPLALTASLDHEQFPAATRSCLLSCSLSKQRICSHLVSWVSVFSCLPEAEWPGTKERSFITLLVQGFLLLFPPQRLRFTCSIIKWGIAGEVNG